MKSLSVSIAVLTLLSSGCARTLAPEQIIYRGDGTQAIAGPLELSKPISFRFVDRWRITHRWLRGPIEIKGCWYEGNPLRYVTAFNALKSDTGTPILERDRKLYLLGSYEDKVYLYRGNDFFYGTSNNRGRENDFLGFEPVCRHVFRDSMDSVEVFLVKPDPAKGTDEWVRGAKPVTLNGLHWLRKTEPIRDWWPSRYTLHRDVAPIETWVLKIPDTPYWLRLVLSSGTGETMPYKSGTYYHPEEHRQVVELFHQMVASVRLEPITPIDIPVDIPPLK